MHPASAAVATNTLMKARKVMTITMEVEAMKMRMERRGWRRPVAGRDAAAVKPAESHEKVG